jgi:hypothetical protein
MPIPPHGDSRPPVREQPREALVLAAVERADRHRPPPRPGSTAPAGARVADVVEHLGPAHPGRPRPAELRRTLAGLAAAGLFEAARRHGVEVWALSPRGRRRLRASGATAELPESPQHRAWRHARTDAAQELPRFRAALAEDLAAARELLAAEPPPASDAWLELAERLHSHARLLGSAQHCLREWPEPSDAAADVDERAGRGDESLAPEHRSRLRALRAGRRNPRLWQI